MNRKKNNNQGAGRYAILFKISSECNDACPFCLEYEFIKSKRANLNLAEFKRNFNYLQDNFQIDYSVLTGGEPTLHPDFFEMLKYIKTNGEPFRFITNLLKFNETIFLRKTKQLFSVFQNKKQRKLSKIIASINDLPDKNKIAQARFEGLKKALIEKLPIMVTVVIYQGNLRDLPKLARYLLDLFKKHKQLVHVEFRMIYIEGTSSKLLKVSLPRDFKSIQKRVETSIKILNSSFCKVTLWNFPLCYLKNPVLATNEGILERQQRKLIKINKDAQLDNFEVRDWQLYLKSNPTCQFCKLKKLCSGIDKKYIQEYNITRLKAVAKTENTV